ncbi:MAG: zinc ribbon-containing protein [Gammaproteobacteria bacterium]|nr:zinc ribbon-containing protein [Gammaproteobacteria bacterium]
MKQGLKGVYLHLIQKLNQLTDKIEYGTKPALIKLWEKSVEVDVSLPDMTTREVEKIANYLARDLKVVSEYGLAAEEGIKAYWQRDSDYMTYKLLNILSKVEDPTTIEWHKLGLGAQDEPMVFTAGELTALNALQCEHCKKIQHFNQISEIPVCQCGHRYYLAVK